MATSKNTSTTGASNGATTTEAARIAGAIKALRALHDLNQVTEEEGYHSAYLDFYMQRLVRVRAMTDVLGPMTPELEGALSVLVEYVCEGLDGGTPDLEFGDWTPLAAMTADEIRDKAVAMERGNSITGGNVIYFPQSEGRAAR